MNILLHIALAISSFLAMEFVAWFSHKYIMHGFMWFLHKDHHHGSDGVLEKNDGFILLFASPAILLLYLGISTNLLYLISMGIGITIYGFVYFFIHEIIIHQRIKLFSKTQNIYILALRRAHKIHHKNLRKEKGECFGMLIVPIRYFQFAKKIKQKA